MNQIQNNFLNYPAIDENDLPLCRFHPLHTRARYILSRDLGTQVRLKL